MFAIECFMSPTRQTLADSSRRPIIKQTTGQVPELLGLLRSHPNSFLSCVFQYKAVLAAADVQFFIRREFRRDVVIQMLYLCLTNRKTSRNLSRLDTPAGTRLQEKFTKIPIPYYVTAQTSERVRYYFHISWYLLSDAAKILALYSSRALLFRCVLICCSLYSSGLRFS